MLYVIIAVLVAYAVYRAYDEVLFWIEEEERNEVIAKKAVGRSMEEWEYTHTSIKKAPIVVHDPIWSDNRKAVFYPAGTSVSIWGVNQKYDGDFIGFWHITSANSQAIILTNNALSASEVDMVALDPNATVIIGSNANVEIEGFLGNEFVRAGCSGNFALHVRTQTMFIANVIVTGNTVTANGRQVGQITY